VSGPPRLSTLVDAADRSLHPWVRDRVPELARREALAEELGFWLSRDLDWARGFAAHAPDVGQPPEAYLNRWVSIDGEAHVLIGPRYLGLDPSCARWSVSSPSCASGRYRRSSAPGRAPTSLLFDILVDGDWAGLLAAERDARRGLRGITVVELILDQAHRGHGYGRHLSTLLARAVPLPDDQFLLGTIHTDNHPAYRSALAAGRVDVGGEIVIPL
jgi:hypothetical protein